MEAGSAGTSTATMPGSIGLGLYPARSSVSSMARMIGPDSRKERAFAAHKTESIDGHCHGSKQGICATRRQ